MFDLGEARPASLRPFPQAQPHLAAQDVHLAAVGDDELVEEEGKGELGRVHHRPAAESKQFIYNKMYTNYVH